MSTLAAPTFRIIPLEAIDAPEVPSRTEMDETRMDELVASIRSLGFISVLVLVGIGERFRVVAGHRRSIAARLAGLYSVPCFVYESESAALDAIQHAENRHREDLSVTDEAIWFSQLHEAHPDEGTDGVAARVGESRNYVENRLLLLKGCDRVFAALKDHAINIGVAMELNKCTEDRHRWMLLGQAIEGGATLSLVRRWVTEWKTVHLPAAPAPVVDGTSDAPGPVLLDEYWTCRVCGERDNTSSMRPMNAHDYCWRQLLDPRTGLFRSKTDYVLFPRTRDEAVKLIDRIVDRFPELVGESAAPS